MDIVNGFNRVKRQVASFSLAALIASFFAVGVAQAQTFPDVTPSDWFYSYVEDLVSQGVVNGSMPSYRPADNVNRAEMAKLVVEAFGIDIIDPSTATFQDVAKGQWYFPYVESIAAAGVVSGYKTASGELTGFYGPADAVARSHASKMLVLGAPLTTNTSCGPSFSDVPVVHDLYPFVETLYTWSVIDGYADGTFKPDQAINRAEIAKIVSNTLQPVMRPCGGFNIKDASAMSTTTVEVCFSADYDETSAMMEENYTILDQDGDELAVTGVESSSDPMCVLLTTASQEPSKSYDLMVENVTSTSGMDIAINDASFTGFSAVGVGGALVCTAGTQPGDKTVPRGATGVNVTVVNCSANADPVVLSTMTFKRTGVGNEQDFTNVYLYDGSGNRLTTGRSINSQTQEVIFGGLNTTIGANQTRSFVVVADIAVGAGAANEHSFQLTDKDDVESNASSVGGTYPVNGSLIRISGSLAGAVTVTKNGSLDELTIGETGRIAQFELQAGGAESMEVRRIALYVRGTCDADDVTDLTLYSNTGEVLAETAEVGAKDLATFVLDNPFVIDQGDSEIFYVTAQVLCRDGETVRTYLDETTDLLVVGNQFGSGVTVTNNYDGTGAQFSEVTVRGSDFTVAFSGMPSSGDVAIGQDDVSCLDLTITNGSGQAIEIRDWQVVVSMLNANATADDAQGLYAANDDPNFTLFKLARVNEDGSIGGTLLGPSELAATETAANDDQQTVTLSGTMTIAANESIDAAVVFDIENSANGGDQVRCTLSDLSGIADSVRDSNGDSLGAESITPAADIVGNIFTLNASGLTIELAASPSSRNIVSGTQDASLAGFSVRSGASLANTLKSLTVTGYVDNDSGNNNFTAGVDGGVSLKDIVNSVGLYDGNTLVSSLQNVNTNGTIIFNNLNIVVPKSTTKNLVLKGKVSNNAPFGGNNDDIKFAVVANTDVIAIDGNGKNVAAASITVTNAANGGAGANPGSVTMTVTSGGSGTTVTQNSLQASVVTGAEKLELARVRFSSTDEAPTLKDLQFGILNVNATPISQIYLVPLTGGVCGTPGSGYTASTAGIFNLTDVNITIPEAGITLCVLGDVNQAANPSQPVSGSNVGVALLNVTEITGGSGTNISRQYNSTDSTELLDGDLTAAATTVVTGNTVAFDPGAVIVVDQEMMLVEADGGANLTVQRGFANTTATTHQDNAVIGISTIAIYSGSLAAADINAAAVTLAVDDGTDFKVGDIIAFNDGAVGAAGGAFEYALVTAIVADDLTIVRGILGSTAVDPADDAPITRFQIHGDLFRLRKSKPTVTLNSLAGPYSLPGSANTRLLSFRVAATGQAPVTFNTANPINVTFNGSGAAFNDNACTLRGKIVGGATEVTYDVVANNADLGNATSFDFSNQSADINPGESYDFYVDCDTSDLNTFGDNVTASFASAATTINWNDSTANIATDGALIIPSALTGPTFLNN